MKNKGFTLGRNSTLDSRNYAHAEETAAPKSMEFLFHEFEIKRREAALAIQKMRGCLLPDSLTEGEEEGPKFIKHKAEG